MAGAIPAVTVDQRSANILLINRFYGYEARVPTARLLAQDSDSHASGAMNKSSNTASTGDASSKRSSR